MNTTRINKAKETVKSALRWSDDDYNTHLFDNGIEYLKLFTGEDNNWLSEYAGEQIFWNWWKRQYLLLDELFIAKLPYIHSDNHNQLINTYDWIHYSTAFSIDETVFNKIFISSDKWVGEIITKKTNQQ